MMGHDYIWLLQSILKGAATIKAKRWLLRVSEGKIITILRELLLIKHYER